MSTVPMTLGDNGNSFRELSCSCQKKIIDKVQIDIVPTVKYREVYRLCSELPHIFDIQMKLDLWF